MKKVTVTGAAGYIGGQVSLALKDAGHEVLGIDRRACPKHLTEVFDQFVQADIDSDQAKTKLIQFQPTAIVHCAGTSLVGPSIKHPSDYYHNNVIKTIHMLTIVMSALPRTRIIFSSSAAVYGEPVMTPCHEVDPCEPVSPYGESKRMVEQILASYHRAYGLDYVAFRYFNACGADPEGRHGQEPGATHIIARVLESIRDGKEFVLNGIDYPTPDGTCVRDYVHVADIARAHVMALDSTVTVGVYNLGSNNGTSNREIIDAAERITDNAVTVQLGKPRPGDPPMLTASAAKFGMAAGRWRQYELDDMIQHAWNWYAR
jgi:UDP-glucose-4-epimerase GalE